MPPVYLDNACTTLVPQQVIESINDTFKGQLDLERHWELLSGGAG